MASGDKKHTIVPDRELLLWEKWIQIRTEETMHLSKKIDRPPADFAMNLLKNVREDKERKTTLEHAQIPKKPTLRGGLWEQKLRLKQKCYCEPVYEVQRTRAEKGRPRVIEHIGVPRYIQVTEKGIYGNEVRDTFPLLNAEYKRYRTKRENELRESINKIDPFRPQLSELMIKGNKPKPRPKKMPPLPEIIVTTIAEEPSALTTSVFALRINNTVFIKDIIGQKVSCLWEMQKENWHESCTSWSYYFNVPVNRMGRSKLFLQNLGTATLRFCWKKIKRTIPFIPENLYEQVFYFNKNEDIISPGQSKEILFSFLSNKPGIYSETWELYTCNVSFFDTVTEKLLINLQGDSVEKIEKVIRKIDFLKGRIKKKVIKTYVKSIINDALIKATTIRPQTYPYKHLFLEADMFVMKNPVCFYHQTEVAKMKQTYTEMDPEEEWNLSIPTWRSKMMEKQYDDRMKYYEILKSSHRDLIKPWFENDDLLKQKYRALMIFICQLADKFDKEYSQICNTFDVDVQQTEIADTPTSKITIQSVEVDPVTMATIHNIFYLRVYEHVATTVELCAGVLSSLDLNRWIEFDFCQW